MNTLLKQNPQALEMENKEPLRWKTKTYPFVHTIYFQVGQTTYNAWDQDIATLNIFFGQETVMGKTNFLNL